MSKYILSLAAVLVCVAGSARADEGISANTLSDMGLAGLTVVSDHDALAIRGMGFRGGNYSKGCKHLRSARHEAAVVGRFRQLLRHDWREGRRRPQRKRLRR